MTISEILNIQIAGKSIKDWLSNFNGANQLVEMDSTGKLPAVDGSQLTNLPSSGGTDTGVGNKLFLYYNFK